MGPRARASAPSAALGPRLAALTLGAALWAGGCARQESAAEGSLALRELEGLAFLPSVELVLVVPSGTGSFESRVFGLDEPVLIDRFEVTRGHWQRYLAEASVGADPLLAARVAGWAPGTEPWPASYMTRAEAADFAAWRGMRLASVDEWLFAALGPNHWPYPWGTTFRESVANTLELGLSRPAAVGTFESGRTPSSCYDLLGNVSEWVSGAAPSADRVPGDERGSALGGSFRTYTGRLGREIYDVKSKSFPLALDLHPESRADHVGLRCAAAAEAYLWRNADAWGRDAEALERLAAVGERFGRQALPLLVELAARPGAAPGLAALAEGARR